MSHARKLAEDPAGVKAAAEADKIRLCVVAVAKFQFIRRRALHRRLVEHTDVPTRESNRTQEAIDTLERIEPWPGASSEGLKFLINVLDYREEHLHVRGSSWAEAVRESGARYADGNTEELDDLDYSRTDRNHPTGYRPVSRLPYVYRYGVSTGGRRL